MEGEFGGGPEGGFLDFLFHRRDGERVIVSAEMTYRRMIEDLWFVYSIFVFGHGFTSGSLWLRGEAGWRWSGWGREVDWNVWVEGCGIYLLFA